VRAPPGRERVLERALHRGSRRGLPGKLESLMDFARHDLALELDESLGADTRDAVLASLEKTVASRATLAAPRPDRSSGLPFDPPTGSLRETLPEGLLVPRVLVATRDVELLRVVSEEMKGTVLVEAVTNVLDLVDALDGGAPVMLLLVDARAHGLGLAGLVTLAPELPREVTVVVWGAAPMMLPLLEAEPRAAEWIRFSEERSTAHLARTCYLLLGGS